MQTCLCWLYLVPWSIYAILVQSEMNIYIISYVAWLAADSIALGFGGGILYRWLFAKNLQLNCGHYMIKSAVSVEMMNIVCYKYYLIVVFGKNVYHYFHILLFAEFVFHILNIYKKVQYLLLFYGGLISSHYQIVGGWLNCQ